MNDYTPHGRHDGPDEEAALFARLEADLATDGPDGQSGDGPEAELDGHDAATAPALVGLDEDKDIDQLGRGVVDPPHAHEGRFGGRRAALLPMWLREPDTLVSAARWAVGSVAHTLAFHGLRLPLYWARLVARSPVGAGRLLRGWWRWTFDVAGRDVHRAVTAGMVGSRRHLVPTTAGPLGALDRAAHAGYGAGADPAAGMTGRLEAETFLRVATHHKVTVRGRLMVSAVAALVAIPVVLSVAAGMSVAGRVLAMAVVLPVLGLAGRAADRPVTSRATDSAAVPRLTSDLIERALGSLGIAELNKALRPGGEGIGFPGPIHREGPGWRADLDLPAGVTAGDVAERRGRVASGLRRPLGCVWPEGDPDVHEGRLVLWVGDQAMNRTKPKPWALAERGTVDLFDAFPLGLDPRGRSVSMTLMFASMVIGAQPRMGKSFTARLILLAAALDPWAELHIYDLKGGADFLPLEQVAHAFRIGDDADDVAYLLADLRELAADMTRRYKTLRGLPREVCPEGKVTPQLARRRSLKLHPVVLLLDECQRAYEHPDHGKEIAALTEDLVKRGPAVAIMAITATQRPDAKSLPPGISSSAVLRYCLKVAGHLENNMVLGTGAFQAGTRATMFARSDKGVGYLAGEGDDPVIVRAAEIDAPTAERIAARARAVRLAADLLTGHAAGVDPKPAGDDSSILDHLLSVWPATEPRLWCETLAERLAAAQPGYYTGWTGQQVTAAVRPHGIRTTQVKRTVDGITANRRGLARTDLLTALTQRDGDSGREADPGSLTGPLPVRSHPATGSSPATTPRYPPDQGGSR